MHPIFFLTTLCVFSAQRAVAEDLWPLAEGSQWTYEITNEGFSPICAPGTFTETIHTLEETDEGTIFTGTTACGYDYTMRFDDQRYYGTYEDEWWLFLDQPADGHTYQGFRSFMRYSQVSEIEVPAGTFQDCFQVQQLVGYTHQWTYCPGIGKVWEKHIDLGGTGWEMKLVSYQTN